jgi:hypothetical protein
MSDEGYRRVETEAQRERLYTAKRLGDRCAACGRPLGVDEPIYIEYFMATRRIPAEAPVGVECASAAFLEGLRGREPERCVGCGRGVYYRSDRSTRRRATCSRRCATRAAFAKRAALPRVED